MTSLLIRRVLASLATASILAICETHADDDAMSSPLHQGTYVSPRASYLIPNEKGDKNAGGGLLALGYRRGWYAIEIGGDYFRRPTNRGSGFSQYGGSLNGLVFPFTSSEQSLVKDLYGILEFGGQQNLNYPTSTQSQKFLTTTYAGGVGDLIPLHLGRYEFAIRAEALYRYGRRASSVNDAQGDFNAPGSFRDLLLSVGLQLPLGRKPPVAEEPAQPVTVVPVVAPQDSDADGVPDSADQCPDTPAGTKVDARGCPLPPPCRTPEAGEKVSLSGCGTGDRIVLRGVNFDTDKASLTVNARTLLNDVVAELKKYPAIAVEIDGHTDSKGSHAHNQGLSERRAKSVRTYLTGHGVEDSRVTSAGFAENQPIADNATDEGRELNRRVELKIVRGSASADGTAAPADSDTSAAPAAAEQAVSGPAASS